MEYCADDFELGHRIAARGHRVELAGCTVSTECAARNLSELFRHELRWAITQRHSRPCGYAGRVLVTQGLPWSLAAAALASSAWVAGTYISTYLVLRLALAWAVGVCGLGDETVRRRWWLVPVRDAIAFVVSLAAFYSNRIEWGGREYELHRGKLVPICTTSREAGLSEPYLRP